MSSGSPRVAMVTGGSGGIGRAICTRLAQDGMQVVVHYAGSVDHANEVVDAISTLGGSAVAIKADVGDEDEVAKLFEESDNRFGGIDVVVNTAGVMILAPLSEYSLDDFDSMMRTNLRGSFIVNQQAVRQVRSGGAIVNFSSSVVKLALPTYSAYAATKGGVEAMTLIMAKELKGRDITSNTVAPGPTETPLFTSDKSQETIDQMADMVPVQQRLGQPEDTAELVAFLAGPGRWVNGQVIYVNGGIAA